MFAFILLAGSVIKDMLGLLAEGQLTVTAFFRLLSVLFPFVFIHALPLGLLTGILLTMGRLSASSEIAAMRASGQSIIRLASPVFLIAILGTAAALVVNFYYGPLAKAEYRRELANTVRKNPLSFVVEKTFVKDFEGAVIYVSEKGEGTMEDIWFWDLDKEARVARFYRAESAYFEYNEAQNTLNLVLENGKYEFVRGEDPEAFAEMHSSYFGKASIQLSLDRILGRATFQKKLKWLTFNELRAEWSKWLLSTKSGTAEEIEKARENLNKVRMAFHEKFAMGFSALSFALLAVPMGIRAQRTETSANLFLALGLALAYYFFNSAIGWMDDLAWLRPDLLYWLPNIVYQALGFWLFVRLDSASKVRA